MPATSKLQDLLNRRPWLLADGATGTNLFAMGLESGEPPEFWTEQQPAKIKALHQAFVDAGADIILTNTFGGNARRLMLHQAEGRTHDLNFKAARLAREVADGAGRPVIVAASTRSSPAITPGLRVASTPAARADAGITAAVVMSPASPRSSSSARRTASATRIGDNRPATRVCGLAVAVGACGSGAMTGASGTGS